MEHAAYTIRIFVASGDPDGLRIIDQMNWTGVGVAFPRTLWPKVKGRKELDRAGVYILIGYGDDDDELQRIYIGEGDGVAPRIDSHDKTKDFWDSAICFTSNAGALNKAHVQWLEYALVKRAKEVGRCRLDNGNEPQAPALTEYEVADLTGFLGEMYRILPLVGLHVFETASPVVMPTKESKPEQPARSPQIELADTVIVPAKDDGSIERVFLGENNWYAIRISRSMLDRIKYCAVYHSSPVSAVEYVAPVKQIEPYGSNGKYRLVFAEPAKKIGPIPFGDATSGSMQGPRYTTFSKLKAAKKVTDLF